MSEIDEPEKVQRRGALDNIRRRRDISDVRFVLSTIEGRRFYWRVMETCGIHRSSMTGNNSTFFNEGERNIGLLLLADLEEADPEAYVKCLKESKQEVAKNG